MAESCAWPKHKPGPMSSEAVFWFPIKDYRIVFCIMTDQLGNLPLKDKGTTLARLRKIHYISTYFESKTIEGFPDRQTS